MNARERVLAVLSGCKPDRAPLDDSYWETTISRWRREGLPAEVSSRDYSSTNEITRISDHSDHSVPNSVSLENYAYAIELIRQYGTYT